MIDAPNGIAVNVLRDVVDIAKLRKDMLDYVVKGPEMITVGRLPLTPAAKRAIDKAKEYAASIDNAYLNTEHLLIGLARLQEGFMSDFLAQQGIKESDLLERIRKLITPDIDYKRKESLNVLKMFQRCHDGVVAIGVESEDMKLVNEGLSQAIRWISEYRIKIRSESQQA